MIPMLKVPAVVVSSLLAACSLYGGDDDGEVGPDATASDAATDAAIISTTYRAEWACLTAECASPIAASDRATTLRSGLAARVSWYRDGDPIGLAAHDGIEVATGSATCLAFPRDAEAFERSAYSLCPIDGAPTMALGAEISWGDSRWSVTLTPL